MWSDLIARELVHEAVASRVAAADHDRQGALLTRRQPEPPVPSVDLDCRRAAARAWAAAVVLVLKGSSNGMSAPAARTAVPTHMAGTSPLTNACGEL